jgi:hypothetical protein
MKCGIVPTFAQHGWVQSSSELLRDLWWKCTTSAECKTVITAVFTIKNVLDPHMINELKDGFKIALRLFCGLVEYQT